MVSLTELESANNAFTERPFDHFRFRLYNIWSATPVTLRANAVLQTAAVSCWLVARLASDVGIEPTFVVLETTVLPLN